MTDLRNALYVSTASTLEIARLMKDGTIALSGSIGSWVEETLEALSCGTIEISHPIAIGAYSLPGDFHKDPADRLLVATARIHEMTLVTMDDKNPPVCPCAVPGRPDLSRAERGCSCSHFEPVWSKNTAEI